MFRARRRMALEILLAPAAKPAAAADEIDASAAARSAADLEATTVLSLAAVLARLQDGETALDRSGVQVLDASLGSRGETVLICSGDPDEEISEIVRGPWMAASVDKESPQIRSGPWAESVERRHLTPGELEAAIWASDEEDSELIAGPWLADEEATCIHSQADIEALLNRR